MGLIIRLIEQAKNPKGYVGSLMLRIMNRAHAGMNTWALNLLELNRNADVVILDIGSGGGKAIHKLSQIYKSGKIYGVDYSAQAVENSIKLNKVGVENGKVYLFQASVSDLPFDKDFFDMITAFQTHYFWPDLENDLKEVYRVLKKEGQFMIVAELYKINYHMKSFKTNEEIKQLFLKTGFQHVKIVENSKNKWLCVIGRK